MLTQGWVRGVLGLGLTVSMAGCQTGKVPNPNDPADVGAISADTLRRNLSAVTDSLANRRIKHEIDNQQYRDLVAKAANELVTAVDPNKIPPAQAWKYAEVLKDAEQWKEAEPVFQIAIKNAQDTKNEDRRVNDSLRLAVVLAHLGKYAEALKAARATFDTPPNQSAPILVSVLLELTPVVRGHGQDLELAKLLEDAISIHQRTKVDPNSDAGKAFLMARPFHIDHAWTEIQALDRAAGREDLAKAAQQKQDAMATSFAPNRVGA